MKHIENRYSGDAIYSVSESMTPVELVNEAVYKRISLFHAHLAGLNLERAHLGRADLRYADLSGANLAYALCDHALFTYADLTGAKFDYAQCTGAGFEYVEGRTASFQHAHLTSANLRNIKAPHADFRSAYMQGANLSNGLFYEANFTGARLTETILADTQLDGAKLSEARLPEFQLVPEEGDFIGWKKVRVVNTPGRHVIAKLLIPAAARRTSSLVGRKCRAEFVQVLDFYYIGHTEPIADTDNFLARSQYDGRTLYSKGATVTPNRFDDDIRVECTNGIHFFMTRQEAERY